MMRPIIFIGSSLDEPSLWQSLEQRQRKGGRGLRELRPRSYLVTPTLSRTRRSLLSAHNIVWLPMTAEEFTSEVLTKLQDDARAGIAALATVISSGRQAKATIPTVETLALDPLRATDYLIGQEPEWSDIQSGRSIARQVDGDISELITRSFSRQGLRGIVVISGTAGSGKSSSLMRAVLRLVISGRKVGWIDRDFEISPRDILQCMRADSSPEILAINDAARYGSELSPLVQEIAKLDDRPLVIVEVRSGNRERLIVGGSTLRYSDIRYSDAPSRGSRYRWLARRFGSRKSTRSVEGTALFRSRKGFQGASE